MLFSSGSDALLPPGADATRPHLFVRDRTSGNIQLVDARADGSPANGGTDAGALSGDGRHVAFISSASNLASGAGDGQYQFNVFVKNLDAPGTVALASRSATVAAANASTGFGGLGDPAISDNGAEVAFTTAKKFDDLDTNSVGDVYLNDVGTTTTYLISRKTGSGTAAEGGREPALSPTGTTVAFSTSAALDSAKDTNGTGDVYYRNRTADTTTLVSANYTNGQAGTGGYAGEPSVGTSGGQLRVAFSSTQTDLVSGDGNGKSDVFVRNVGTSSTALVSRPNGSGSTLSTGNASAPSISADGSRMAFASTAGDLVAGVTAPAVTTRIVGGGATTLVSDTAGPSGATTTPSGTCSCAT